MNLPMQLKVVCLCATLALVPSARAFAADEAPSARISEAGFGSHTAPAQKIGGGLNETLFVTFDEGEAQPVFDWLVKAKKGSLRLYLNGELVKGISGEWYPAKPVSALRFDLLRNSDNREQWGKFLGASWFHPRKVSITVGTEDRSFVADSDKTIQLDPRAQDRWWLLALAVAIVVGTLIAAFKTSLLRDSPVPSVVAGVTVPAPTPVTFSLAKSQMCFWFLHIVVAFLLISAVTGTTDTITPTMLVLMGISSATAAGSVAINQTKPTTRSVNFLTDVICDHNGASLHRLQMAAWTLVLSCVFWASVWDKLVMPEFDATMLTLMGISSGTYFGFKFQERP
jgi:hypothetical protein